MPLGERPGDKSDSRYCGVETEFNDDIPQLLTFNINGGGFDFVVATLMDPTYRPSLTDNDSNSSSGVLPFAGSDLVLSPSQWSSHVVGRISSWIDLDSGDELIWKDSEIALKQEVAWASHLSLKACLLPSPKGTSCGNYARCVNQILQSLNNMQLWLRIPLEKTDEDDYVNENADHKGGHEIDSWESWNSFRLLCDHHSLRYLQQIRSDVDLESLLEHTNIVISGNQDLNPPVGTMTEGAKNTNSHIEGIQRHPLRSYMDYVGYLYKRMDSLPEQERFELGYRDFLQSPLQPLMDNLEAQTYEIFEKDTMKYMQYQRAIGKALQDRIPDEQSSTVITVLMVVGAGRGPLVRASLQLQTWVCKKIVYAVEKNPNAVVTLHSLVKLEGWEDIFTVVSSDMRCWDAPEKADILVSELLGSFGDNELSPECLYGAQRFLKQDGVSIPSLYTSFIQPVTASKLYTNIKSCKDLVHFETAYVVKLHSVARLAPSQSVFTFAHPEYSTNNSNQRYKKLQFELPSDTGSAMIHGFAGYFDATLYKDVRLGIEPMTATPNMFSWFPIFIPLRTPVCVRPGFPLEVHFWRCCDSTKVWYEWCVTSPVASPIHNSNGRSY